MRRFLLAAICLMVTAPVLGQAAPNARLAYVWNGSALVLSGAGSGQGVVGIAPPPVTLYCGPLPASFCDFSSGGGSVTTVSAGSLSPLFTTNVANPTTAPALTFSLTNAAANSYLGNSSGSAGAYSFLTFPSCSTSSSALNYTSGTGVGCNASILASSLASPGANAGWYNNAANTIAAITAANNCVIGTNGSGVPSCVTTFPSGVLGVQQTYTVAQNFNGGLQSSAGSGGGFIAFGPLTLSRNAADTVTAATITQLNASSTGNIVDFKNSGGLASSVTHAGNWQSLVFYSAAGTALPTCNAGAKGTHAEVSDATTPTYLGTYTSGGAVYSPVACNGTNWVTY